MHQAPAVQWEVSRTRFQGMLLVILLLGVAGVYAAWWFQSDETTWVLSLASVAAVLAGVLACRAGAGALSGSLRWDGQAWTWSPMTGQARPGRPAVAIDLQFTMLVCWHSHGGGRCWFWLAQADDKARWRALRRALFCGRAEGPDATEPRTRLAGPR